MPRWHNQAVIGFTGVPVFFHLDDGTVGTLHVYAGACVNPAECGGPRDDCGCFESDSYWIDVLDLTGRTVAHLHLWAAYGDFDVVPVDLVDGRGDELVIVRRPAHSAPPTGLDLRIWKLSSARAEPLLAEQSLAVSGYLQTVEGAVPCATWRTRLLIDRSSTKPRTIALRADFAVDDWPESGCHPSNAGTQDMNHLKRERRLQFEDGHYHLR